jgi:hypothetical protein
MKLQRLRRLGITCVGGGLLSGGMLFAGESAASRQQASADVMKEIMATPDKAIPFRTNSHANPVAAAMAKLSRTRVEH